MEHKTELFTEFDVDEQGYVQNEKGRLLSTIRDELLAEIPAELQSWEYFSVDAVNGERLWPVENLFRILVYVVPGGNEGYYLHVDAYSRDKNLTTLFLVKFLGNKSEAYALEAWLRDKIFFY